MEPVFRVVVRRGTEGVAERSSGSTLWPKCILHTRTFIVKGVSVKVALFNTLFAQKALIVSFYSIFEWFCQWVSSFDFSVMLSRQGKLKMTF